MLEIDGFEADDIIGTVSHLAIQDNKELKVIIVTGDLDTLQLVNATEQGAENIPNSIGYNPFEVITEKAGFISEVTQKAINISMYPPPTIIRKDK